MLKSMTAYGRATTETPAGVIGVEILSVNRKHLEFQINLPNALTRYEIPIRKWIGAVVKRGQVTVRVSLLAAEKSPVTVKANIPLAKELYQAWSEIKRALSLKEEVSLLLLAEEREILTYDSQALEEGRWEESLEHAIGEALKPFQAMKSAEGKILSDDLRMRLGILSQEIEKINSCENRATEKYRVKLKAALESVLGPVLITDERLLKEVCLFAEKIDITEEIVRFKSHLGQVETLFKEGAESVGKTLEFILQELGREINTIASKAADYTISESVVIVKSELDRIREQVQNVE